LNAYKHLLNANFDIVLEHTRLFITLRLILKPKKKQKNFDVRGPLRPRVYTRGKWHKKMYK